MRKSNGNEMEMENLSSLNRLAVPKVQSNYLESGLKNVKTQI